MKSECRLHSPQALVPWAAGTSLKPGQARFRRMDCHGADGAGEDVPANEPIDLPGVPAPLCRGPQPPDPGGPPAVKLRLLHLKDVGPLGWKSFEKPRGLYVSWCWGSHLQPPSLGSPHLWMKPPSTEWVLKQLGFVQGMGEGRMNGSQALGVSPGTFPSDNPGTGLSPRLWLPQ